MKAPRKKGAVARRAPGSAGSKSAPSAVPAPPQKRVVAARQLLAQARAVLMSFPNVRGVGVGLQRSGGKYTGNIAFVVTVGRKDTPDHPRLDAEQHVPKKLFGIPVDVQQVPMARLKQDVAGGGDVREAGHAAAGLLGFVAKTQAGRVHALTAMHVFNDVISVKPAAGGPYFDVQARMFVGNFEPIGKLFAGEFTAQGDIASVLLDAGVGSSRELLGTNVTLGRPRAANLVTPGVGVEIAVPGEDRLQGHLANYPIDEPFPTSAGFVTFQDLMHFRIAGRGIEDGWSGSVVFDPAREEPLALLSFGTDAVDVDGFSHVYGFPLAGRYESWGLRPL